MIFFGSAVESSFVFVSVRIPIHFCAFLAWKFSVSGNFSIWCGFACLKKKGVISGIPTRRSGYASLRIVSL